MFERVDTLVCLVGEQPVPNLLAIRRFQPKRVVLVFSDRTERVSTNLVNLLSRLRSGIELISFNVEEPFNLLTCTRSISDEIDRLVSSDHTSMVFNITGGTKPMSLAAFMIASQMGARVVYLQSEGSEPVFYSYSFDESSVTSNASLTKAVKSLGTLDCSATISIADYLAVHGIQARQKDNKQENSFEKAVYDLVSQCMTDKHRSAFEINQNVYIADNVELDLIIRYKNQIAVAEVKSGSQASKKHPIDQLVAATRPDRLGTYTKRILILDREPESNNAELAKAHAIEVVSLTEWDAEKNQWKSESDQKAACERLAGALSKVFNLPSKPDDSKEAACNIKS
jgi:hypothetical protein